METNDFYYSYIKYCKLLTEKKFLAGFDMYDFLRNLIGLKSFTPGSTPGGIVSVKPTLLTPLTLFL